MEIEGRVVRVHAWQYDVVGVTDFKVPVILLDTDVEDNSGYDRSLTDYLYGGDQNYRLAQEAILGIGGVRIRFCARIWRTPRFWRVWRFRWAREQ